MSDKHTLTLFAAQPYLLTIQSDVFLFRQPREEAVTSGKEVSVRLGGPVSILIFCLLEPLSPRVIQDSIR